MALQARFESWPNCYGGVIADPIIPKKPGIQCKNGGTASKDGKTCTYPRRPRCATLSF